MSVSPSKKPVPPRWKIKFQLEVYQLDYSTGDILKITLDHLTKFFHQFDFKSVELTSLCRKDQKFVLVQNDKFVSKSCYACEGKTIEDDEPFFDLWNGSIDVEESTAGLDKMINHLSGPVGSLKQTVESNGNKLGFLWKLDDKNDDRFEKLSSFEDIRDSYVQKVKINGFSFGNIINGTRFVEAFNSRNDFSQLTHDPNLRLEDFDFNLLHTEKSIELFLGVNGSDEMKQTYKLVFGYESVKQVTISWSYQGCYIFFHLKNPPKISILTDDLDPDIIDMRKSKFHAFDYHIYQRGSHPKQRLDKVTWTRWHDCKCLTTTCIGKSSVFAINLPDNYNSNRLIFTNIVNKFYLWRRYSPTLNISFGYIEIIDGGPRFPVDIFGSFPFEVYYALQCIHSVSYAFENDLIINDQLNNLLTFINDEIANNNTERLVNALYELCRQYLYGKVYHGLPRLKTIFKRKSKSWSSIKKVKSSNSYIKQLRRVIITPTRVLILPESSYQSSQFLEIADVDCVLRVTIRDEDMSSLGFSVTRVKEEFEREAKRVKQKHPAARLPSPEMYFLKRCVIDRLYPSLNIAGKSYHFYGASSSQLREHGMVFYAKDSLGRDYKAMRNEIGIIKSNEVAKYISRVGLSLTQALASVDLPSDTQIIYTEDILDGDHPESHNPYNFTDGCGLMSPQLAKYIWKDLKHRGIIKLKPDGDQEEKIPTAYQIRFMGGKGMIVLDKNLIGNVLIIRESMSKMDCDERRLRIVKISAIRRAYLNKPFVTILNQIGLSNEIFITLLSNAIGDLVDSFHCNIKASKALTMFSYLQRFINHAKLAEYEYDLLGDPFFRTALNLVFHQGLDAIKQKARIPLDLSTARTLFGVADPTATHHLPYVAIPTSNNDDSNLIKVFDHTGKEIHSSPVGSRNSLCFNEETERALKNSTLRDAHLRNGVLKHGQVFVFPSDFEKPLTCNVVVTKFPCMHPGDVRILKAVDVPELHGIRDCIVFPVDGPRPHANEMAGSDLDGDEYCVIWSSDFMNIRTFDPMDFPDKSQKTAACIDNREILNFFMQYIRDCAIGRIASAHLAWADMLPDGIFNTICIGLANKYCVSLDFVKTSVTELLNMDEIPREAADFMQNWENKASYHSNRALGAIIRTILMFELFLGEETSRLKVLEPKSDYRLLHPNWKKFERQASKQHQDYSSIVSYLLEINEFSDEAELFTQISDKNTSFGITDGKVHRPTSYQDTMIYCIDHQLVKVMEENFYREFDSPEWQSKSQDELNEAKMAKASAYYQVSMKKITNRKKRFYGLPWIGKYSSHLFDLLRNPKSSKKQEDRLTANVNTPTSGCGFSVNSNYARCEAANACWNYLVTWLSDYLSQMEIPTGESKRIINETRELFSNIKQYYISRHRKNQSPGSVLGQIFLKIKEKQKSLSFGGNLFDSCNDPIGLMAVLILERVYYEGTAASKIPDGSFNCWSNSTYSVLISENPKEEDVPNLMKMLTYISGCVNIVHTPLRSKEAFKLSIYGSRASILICQTIIGLHNRLKSSYPHYQIGM